MSKPHEANTCFGDPQKTSNGIQEAAYALGAKEPSPGSEEAALELLWREAKRRSGGADDKSTAQDIAAFIWQLHALHQGKDHADRAVKFARLRIRVLRDAWQKKRNSAHAALQ